jgi:primary-amine oxidase
MAPHPLSALSVAETNKVRDIIVSLHPNCVLDFRTVYMLEPPKAEVVPFLALEHAGKVTPRTKRPPRLAQAKYDVIGNSKTPQYHESVIDINSGERRSHQIVGTEHHASLTV